jgi:hypothetical protein
LGEKYDKVDEKKRKSTKEKGRKGKMQGLYIEISPRGGYQSMSFEEKYESRREKGGNVTEKGRGGKEKDRKGKEKEKMESNRVK